MIHIHAPAMHAVKTDPEPARWCFGCRKHHTGTWTMWAADDWENDYYGPHWAFTCDRCGHDRRLGFGLVPE